MGEPHRLTPRVARELSSATNQLWLSPVSLWETLLLFKKGRLQVAERFSEWCTAALAKIPLLEAPLNFEVAQALSIITLPHADPADHFLAASAKVFDLTLVTADEKLIAAAGIKVLANR
jgi:PIN domain nuclease of toxin-antitoxin system